jgi:deazaflavin-dependent oxidoreductase (nitroreductase family)
MTRLLNPVIVKLAGRRRFPMGVIRHVGRRSGISYTTSVRARVTGDIVLIPLTFGNQSDWARNVEAAGRCSITLNGRAYHAVRPQFVDWAAAKALGRANFNPFERFGFRLFGVKQFIRLAASVDTSTM